MDATIRVSTDPDRRTQNLAAALGFLRLSPRAARERALKK
jgi:hypothetical protein